MKPLINSRNVHAGPRDDVEPKLRRLQMLVEALTKRVETLEAKRGPGRPRLNGAMQGGVLQGQQ